MQPGMRVVLATAFWLAVLVAGTVGHHPAGRLIFDQYSSPFDPHQYGVYRRAGGQPDWKDQDPVEKNHPFDPSINPPRSITNTGHDFTEAQLHHGAKYLSTDPASRDFSPSSAEDKQPRDPPVDDELVSKKGRAKSREDLSRFEESFVADDTFQDQGPGSLEIYKLDLLRERPLLHGHQVTMFPSGKSKVPKKTSHAAWKPAKTAEYGGRPPPGLPMLLRKQSNSFDEPSTEVPPSADLFGVGGVPELQVGCEGLEAAHYKERRSIDGVRGPRDKARDPWLDVTPITLDLDYEGGGEEEEEEMDELLKLKRLETTTNGVKRNRGDMDAKLHSEFHSDKGAEKLPVRGDLGSSRNNGSSASSARPSRRLLWAAEGGAAHGGEGEGRRRGERGKRALWGFGENEGVAGSDELQTENQRRRMYQERRREQEEEEGRRRAESEIERIRGEYERRLDERQREEEERQRRLQQSNRWQLEAEQRRRLEEEEERRREVLEERSREEEERRQREEEARRRKEQEEEMDRRRFKERRREWLLKQRRLEEEEEERNVTAEREWLRKLERNRPIEFAPLPSSPHHHRHHQQQQQQEQRRPDPSMMDRRKEERKLLEYVRRNQPVQVSRANDSYERNLAEQRTQYAIYNSRNGRRNHGPSAPTNIDPSSYAEESRRREAARRIEEEEEKKRREREERMREAERREEEVRRRLSRLYEEERRRKEAARLEAERMAKVQREEEERRSRAGGRTREYEDRRRFDHRRRQDLIPANLVLNQSRRPVVERARQRQEEVERRRQEEERRAKEAREREERDRIMKEQWRRQEEARLNALPVSARIIVQPQKPKVISRIGEFDIDFPGANPFQGGVRFPNFPAPPTRRPPVQSPPPCVWAVIQCCPSNQRLVKCFESLGCPGVNWDSNPCRDNVSEAARAQVEKFYRETEDEEERY